MNLLDEIFNIDGSIFIPPQNKMTGKVEIIAAGDSNLTSSVTIKRFRDIEGTGHIYSDYVVEEIGFPPRLGNQRRSYLDIPYRKDIQGNIGISPANKMTGILDVIQPPKKTLKINPIKDSFVRESIKTLNYGTSQSMLVGYNSIYDEKYRSFVQFDLSSLPEDIEIDKAELKLYNNDNNEINQQIGLYSANSEWEEKGITWINQPAIKSFVDGKNINEVDDSGYLNFNVQEQITDWYENNEENYGFILKSTNETIDEFYEFNTKESYDNQPILEITYHDNKVYSFGRLEVNSNIFVYAVDDNSINGSLNIRSYDTNAQLYSSLHVLNQDMIETSITINRPEVNSSINIRRNEFHDLISNVSIRQKLFKNLNGNLTINARERIGHIFIPYRYDMNSTVNIRANENNNLTSNLTVSRDFLQGNITVAKNKFDELASSIVVSKEVYSKIDSSISVIRREIPSHINVVLSDSINSNITIIGHKNKNVDSSITILSRSDINSSINVVGASVIPSSIKILSGYLKSNMVVPAYSSYDTFGSMTVRTKFINEIPSTIFIGGDNVAGGYVIII